MLVRSAFCDGVVTETDWRRALPDNELRWEDIRMRLAGDAMVHRGHRRAKEVDRGARTVPGGEGIGYIANLLRQLRLGSLVCLLM